MAKVKELKITSADADNASKQYFESEHKLSSLNAEIALKMQAVQEEYADQVREFTEKKQDAESKLQKYLEDNKDKLFSEKVKSTTIGRVVCSYRKGKGTLVIAKDGATWDEVLAIAKEKLPDYVKQVDQLEKDKLIKDSKDLGEAFDVLGVKIEVKDTLSFKLKD